MAKKRPTSKKPKPPAKFNPRSASPQEKRKHYAARHTKPHKPYGYQIAEPLGAAHEEE